jgi:hypothetical protein
MKRARGTSLALLVVLVLDLLVVLVTGGDSIFAPFGLSPVRPLGFLVRSSFIAALVLLRFTSGAERRNHRASLLLWLLLLPTLAQFHFAGGRLGGDGISYYVYTRSLVKDHDLDFTDEYAHYGLIDRSDIQVKTKTGLRRSIFAIGPGLVSIPFFLVGEVVGRAQALMGRDVDLSGYGDLHVHAVGLGGCLYGFLAVLLIHAVARRHFREGTALGAALLIWFATFLPWYMTQQPIMSHATSTCAAALVLFAWDRGRGRRGRRGFLMLGLLLGLSMCIRWQNGVLLLLPAFEILAGCRGGARALARALSQGLLVLTGGLVGVLPQMLAWKTLYDEYVLRAPPHGADFLRLDHPFVLNTLFSSRHGLLSWTPVLWTGYLGMAPLIKRRAGLAYPLLLPLLLMTYVNMCSGDWWAGGSFSNRRFDSLLPILALGLAASLELAHDFLTRRPQAALGLLAAPFVLWNLILVEQVRRGLVPRDDTVDGSRLVGNAAGLVSDAVGFPTTWPASWLFAWRERISPGHYDELVGRYLFYRQHNLAGHIELWAPESLALLGEGFGPVEKSAGPSFRRTRGRARIFAPLDVPEDLEVVFHTAAAGNAEVVVTVFVNDREAGRFLAGATFADARLRVGAAFWRRETNDLVLDPGSGELLVASIDVIHASGTR